MFLIEKQLLKERFFCKIMTWVCDTYSRFARTPTREMLTTLTGLKAQVRHPLVVLAQTRIILTEPLRSV